MNHRIRNTTPFLVLMLMLAAATWPSAASAQPRMRVQLEQLNWLADNGQPLHPCSRVGEAEFTLLPSRDRPGTASAGYVQLMTALPGSGQSTWSVRNLYFDSAPFKTSVQFALEIAPGTCLNSLRYSVLVTPQPVPALNLPATTTAGIEAIDYLVGGYNGGGSGRFDTPLTIGPWFGPSPAAVVLRSVRIPVPVNKLATIDEGELECAPAAAARSIKYLLRDHPEIATDPAQTISDDLGTDMGTNGAGGEGTGADWDGTDPNPDALSGKNAYTTRKGLPIGSALVRWNVIGAVMTDLRDGADVEIFFVNDDGGHVAMVTSITALSNGQYQITYVDDPVQGDDVAENKEHTIVVNADGTIVGGGHVDGFMVETATLPDNPQSGPSPWPIAQWWSA